MLDNYCDNIASYFDTSITFIGTRCATAPASERFAHHPYVSACRESKGTLASCARALRPRFARLISARLLIMFSFSLPSCVGISRSVTIAIAYLMKVEVHPSFLHLS